MSNEIVTNISSQNLILSIIEQVAWAKSSLLSVDTNVKHANSTTIEVEY
jgi:hypothetical protein